MIEVVSHEPIAKARDSAAPSALASVAGVTIELDAVVHTSWAQLAQRFALGSREALPAATPFQSGAWLQAWYDTIGAQPGTEPVPLEIRDANTGRALLGVPLIRSISNSQQIVEFADASLTDYNAPLIGEGLIAAESSGGRVAPGKLLALLRQHLRGCDQLRLNKMPASLAGMPNPFTQLPGNRLSPFGTNVVSIDGSWSDYRKRLAKKVRKELERSLRVFHRDGTNARFEVVRDPIAAVAVLEQMEVLQAQRMRELGLPFVLNEPEFSAFYRRLIELELGDGRLRLTVLKSEADELVGALLGLVDGSSYAMVRLAHAGQAWSHCSPGKLMIDQTMQHLHGEGIRRFDFTTGDYTYKKGFLTQSEPLIEVVLGLSLKGRMSIAGATASTVIKERLRRYPRAFALAKKLGSSRQAAH